MQGIDRRHFFVRKEETRDNEEMRMYIAATDNFLSQMKLHPSQHIKFQAV
jgi:hypothetical protein